MYCTGPICSAILLPFSSSCFTQRSRLCGLVILRADQARLLCLWAGHSPEHYGNGLAGLLAALPAKLGWEHKAISCTSFLTHIWAWSTRWAAQAQLLIKHVEHWPVRLHLTQCKIFPWPQYCWHHKSSGKTCHYLCIRREPCYMQPLVAPGLLAKWPAVMTIKVQLVLLNIRDV